MVRKRPSSYLKSRTHVQHSYLYAHNQYCVKISLYTYSVSVGLMHKNISKLCVLLDTELEC